MPNSESGVRSLCDSGQDTPIPPPPDNFNPGVIRFSFIEIPLSSCKQHVLFQISKNQQKIMIIVITLSLDNPLFVCRLCWNNCLFLVNYQIFDMKHFVYITLKELSQLPGGCKSGKGALSSNTCGSLLLPIDDVHV